MEKGIMIVEKREGGGCVCREERCKSCSCERYN